MAEGKLGGEVENPYKLKTREESKQETREALLQAGMNAFIEEGVDHPSLEAICARAGFTRGAFYVHFKDRDDFLVAVIDQALTDFINSIIATSGEGEDVKRTIKVFAEVATSGPMLPMGDNGGSLNLRLLLEAGSRIPEIKERFAFLIQGAIDQLVIMVKNGQTEKTVRNDVKAEMGAVILVAAAIGLLAMIDHQVEVDLDGIRETAFKLIMR